MATFLVLATYTQQGMATIKDSPQHLDAARLSDHPLGVEVKAVFLTMGRYDMVGILKAPDDQAVAKAMLILGAHGNMRTETLRAFDEREYRTILEALPE